MHERGKRIKSPVPMSSGISGDDHVQMVITICGLLKKACLTKTVKKRSESGEKDPETALIDRHQNMAEEKVSNELEAKILDGKKTSGYVQFS